MKSLTVSGLAVFNSDEVLEAMALASRTLYEVLGLGLGRHTFCNYSMK